jgi:uncharacterized protein YdaU (DUF1376 family)
VNTDDRPKVLSINRTVSDFVSDTQHLTTLEIGAYTMICDQIVTRGQDADPPSIPDDDVMLANITRLSVHQWRKLKPRLFSGDGAVLSSHGGRVFQVRVALEIEEARRRIEGQAAKGRRSGEVRRAKADLRRRFFEPETNTVRTGFEPRSNPSSNRSGTTHESRVTSYEEGSKQESTFAGAREGTTSGPKEEPPRTEPVPTPDFAAVKRVDDKLAASALKVPPPHQVTAAWMSDYGEELIVETLADCEDQYKGKHFKYLESILTNRRDNPDQRPGQRRARRNDGTASSGNDRGGKPGRKVPVNYARYDG